MNGAHQLQNIMRLQGMLVGSGRATPRTGIVSAFHPDSYCAKVKLLPSKIETGWIPVGTQWGGAGWGCFAPPPIGALVSMLFEGDSIDVGCITNILYNDEDTPLAVDAGEYWLVHKTGTYFKMKNDGSILTKAQVFKHTGAGYCDGPLSASGNLSVGTGATGSFTTAAGNIVTVQDGIVTNIY